MVDALRDLLTWLEEAGAEAVIVGGVACSVLGRPRMTRDIDVLVLVDESDLLALLDRARSHEIEPRRADCLEFATRSRVLLLRHRPTGVELDVILGQLPLERGILERRRSAVVGGLTLPVPTPEDLILLKVLAGRPRDLEDIRGLLHAHPELDLGPVRQAVAELSAALEEPALERRFEELLRETGRDTV